MAAKGNYLPFEEAREFVRSLNLQNNKEWIEYYKSGNKPNNIPKTPHIVYKDKGWVSIPDWLGYKIEYINFKEAREFVRSLNLKSEKEWRKYYKSDKKPNNIPSTPERIYKDKGWIGWSDFLGTKKGFDGNYLSFEEARKFVHALNFKNITEWYNYIKFGNKPDNIVSNPSSHFKNKGWISFPDWLGYKHKKPEHLSFEEAREFVHKLNLKTKKEWSEYCKSDDKPNNIPYAPHIVYKDKGWLSIPDWLGTKKGFDGEYLSFEEAREFVHKLNLKSGKWPEYCKSNDKPNNIPSKPERIYKDKGWLSWGDWLGIKKGFDGEYLSFEEAREFVHKLNLKNSSEWREYCKSDNKHNNIPADPYTFYKNNGWKSMADWLGYFGDGSHQWKNNLMLDYIKSLQDELINLDSIQLITILKSNNIANRLNQLGKLNDLISSPTNSEERRNIINNIINDLENASDDETETNVNGDDIFDEQILESDSTGIHEELETQNELAHFDPIEELRMFDNTLLTSSLDSENIDFLIKYQLKKLWNTVLNNNINIEEYKSSTGGKNFTIIKDLFFEEYNEVANIKMPPDYVFEFQPNLMQKLITYRLLKEKTYGNWSGTGSGKTLSAIVAGRVAGVKNVIIVCNNATIEGWVKSIDSYFLNNNIYIKSDMNFDKTDRQLQKIKYNLINDKYNIKLRADQNNYLILNYETFQLGDGDNIVNELLKNNKIDYLVLDEIQNVKQRDEEESMRRNVVNKLIIHSKENNEELLLLAMSATPIINNLTEPKKLIELMTSSSHDELNTKENVNNGVEMHKMLTRYGLRFKPNYGITVNEEFIHIDGEHLIEELSLVPKGQFVEFEKVLLRPKLDGIKDKIKRGALIYTHYVTDLIYEIGSYVEGLGFKVGYYTGSEKDGLNAFKNGKIDVLIGSSPVGTGVDGIQKICNTLIPIILPWTNSEYQQLVGRINRQGSNYKNVDVYIPQVTINIRDNEWSWDKRRFDIIKYKATLADLAIDGIIPRNLLPSKERLLEDARQQLNDWISRLNNDEIITFERNKLSIPLSPITIEKKRKQLGELSELNKSWSSLNSDTLHSKLLKDESEWYYYHTLYSKSRETWSEFPYKEIAKKINNRPEWIIGDFGCGENLLAKEIANKIYAFDHVAIDDSVISCDIINVPIENEILDVAVFSLSLMGRNYIDYIKEAYRTLKPYGTLFICEPESKWKGREDKLTEQIESAGFKCLGIIRKTNKFIYIDAIKY